MKKGNLRHSPLLNEAQVATSLAALTRVHLEAANTGNSGSIETPAAADPLIDTINAYRDGRAQLNAIPADQITRETEDALVDSTYGVPMRNLLAWDQPALTREGAIEALQLMEEEDVFIDAMGEPLRLAVLGYLENERASISKPYPARYRKGITHFPEESETAVAKVIRYADELHDAVVRYLEAERVINALDVAQGTPEEKAFHAIIEEIHSSAYSATSAPGAMAALRLAQQELKDFDGGSMAKALIDGAMAYFDEIEKTSGSALHDSLGMAQAFPEPQGIEGAGWAAIYDGLTSCITTLSGIVTQPRGAGDAGAYLETIEDFLRQERERMMRVAVECGDKSRDDGNHTRLVAAIQFLTKEADLRYNDKVALLAFIKGMEARA